jgi:hypothetical protein
LTTVFVFRVGPIRADDADVFLYVPMADDATYPVVDALDDLAGLALIAQQCDGCVLTCEPALEAAGLELGFLPAPYDERTTEQAAAVSASVVMAESITELRDRSKLLPFLREAGAYRRADLSTFWPTSRPIRVHLHGARGGVAVDKRVEVVLNKNVVLMFWEEGAAQRFMQAMEAGKTAEADQLHRYHVAFVARDTFAAGHLRRAYALDALPETSVHVGGKKLRLDDADFDDVTALLFALVHVTPSLARAARSLTYKTADGELTAEISAGPPIVRKPV